MPPFDFQLSKQKADRVAEASNEKQQRIGEFSALREYSEKMDSELAAFDNTTPTEYGLLYNLPDESLIEKSIRGAKEGVAGTLNLGFGLGAGAAAIVESITGKGGIATKMKETAAKHFLENQQEMASHARPEDSLTYSWDQAKNGNFGALLDWAAHGTGYVGSQLATMLTGAGIAGVATKALGKKAITQVMSGLVEKEALRIAGKELGKKAATREIAELAATEAVIGKATSSIAGAVGRQVGMVGLSFGLEGGEILGDLAQQSIDRDKPLTAEEIGKGLTATALAGSIEYIETLLNIKALKGKLPGASGISGKTGKLARGALTGVQVSGIETVQEAAQTALERWGQDQEVFSEEGIQEIIDAAGMGALGGGPASIGGLVSRSTQEQKDAEERLAERQRIKPQTAPKFKEKVTKAAQSEEELKKYSDPKNSEFNETIAIRAMQEKVKNPEVSQTEKLKTRDDAVELLKSMHQERVEGLKRLKEIEASENPEQYEEESQEIVSRMDELKIRIDDNMPWIRAIMQNEDEAATQEAIKEFDKAIRKKGKITDGHISNSLRKIYGSNGGANLYGENAIDLKGLLDENRSRLSKSDIAILEKEARVQTAVKNVISRSTKSSGQVTSDILTGDLENGYMGLPHHRQGIISALDQGDVKTAQKRQNKFKQWANNRQARLSTFKKAYAEFEKTGEKVSFQVNGLPYYADARTFGLIQTMELETKALQEAVSATQSLFTQEAEATPAQEQKVPKIDQKEDSTAAEEKPIQWGKRESTLEGMGFSKKQIQEMRVVERSWYASQKDTPVKTLEAKLWAVKHEEDNPRKVALFEKLIALKKQKEIKSEPPVEVIPNEVQETKPDLTAVKDMPFAEVITALNSEMAKPKDTINIEFVKALRDRKHELRREPKRETKKETKTGEVSEEIVLNYVKSYFKEYPQEDIDSIKLSPSKFHKHDNAIKAIGKAFGVQVRFYESDSYAVNANSGIAVYGKENFVFINRNTPESYLGILGHEITHQLKRQWPDLYQKLEDSLVVTSEEFTKFKDALLANVKGTPSEAAYAKTAHEELIAMFVGEQFGEKSFWDKIQTIDGTLFDKLIRIAKKTLETAMQAVTPVSQHFSDLDQAHKTVVEVMNEAIRRKALGVTQAGIVTQKIIPNNSDITVKGLKELTTSPIKTSEDFTKSLNKFRNDFSRNFIEVFKAKKNKKFFDEDPIQYLLQEDQTLPKAVEEAMMAVGYKWLATQASSYASNSMNNMKGILGIQNDDTDLTSVAQKALRNVGLQSNYLTESLGKEIYSILGIKIGQNADHDLKNRLELSLGSMAIATMQQYGVLNIVHVDGSLFNQLKKDPDANIDPTKFIVGARTKTNRDTVIFYRPEVINHKKIQGIKTVSPRIAQISKVWKDDTKVWDKIYSREKKLREYSWEPPKKRDMKTKRAFVDLTQEQINNLHTYEKRPWVANAPVMDLFLDLDLKTQRAILGYKDTATQHISEEETNKGINLGIDRSIERLQDWVADAKNQDKGLKSEFYIPGEFWKQERMGMIGPITPQGDTLHRAAFNMKEWEQSIMLDNPDHHNLFMLGVGMYLDIEFAKEGGIEPTVTKVEEKLKEPIMQNGIEVIEKYLKGETLKDSDIAAIVAAVQEGDVQAQSLKALVEYTRYMMAKNSDVDTFDTTMTVEIDGTANGPAFGRWQLMSIPEKPLLHLAALQTGGFRFHENQDEGEWDLSEHLTGPLNHDAYKITGFAWALTLLDHESELYLNKLDPKKKKYAKQDIDKMQAFREIMGNPIDPETGNVSNEMRKLAKGPTMKTMYSMGKAKLVKELVDSTIDTIHQKIKKAALDNDQEALDKLNNQVNTLTWDWLFPAKKQPDGSYKTVEITKEKALNIQLSKKAIKNLTYHIKKNQGPALFQAIKNVFSEIKDNSGTLNQGIGLSTVLYNALRRGYIAKALDQKPDGERLSNKELKEIDKNLKNLFPQIQGAGGSLLPMAGLAQNRDYDSKHPVIQSYAGGRSTPARKISYPRQIAVLEDPGVSGSVLGIQHMDAAVANKLMPYFAFLNTHDGFTVGILQAADLAKRANTIFTQVNTKYSLAGAVNDLVISSKNVFDERVEELTKDFDFDINTAVYNEITKTPIGKESIDGEFISIKREDTFKAVQEIMDSVATVSKETQEHKDILTKSILGTSQYYFPGGEYVTKNTEAKEIFNIVPSQITKERTTELESQIQYMQDTKADFEGNGSKKEKIKQTFDKAKDDISTEEMVETIINETPDTEKGAKNQKTLGSSGLSDLSINPVDYATEVEVNSGNLLSVYEAIKNDGAKQDSDTHNTHLTNILSSIVQDVINPLDLFTRQSTDATEGKFVYDPETKAKIFINSGVLNQGLSMSTGETYVHELVHAVTHVGLDLDKRLRAKVNRLYNVTYDALKRKYGNEVFKVFLDDPTIDISDPVNAEKVKIAQAAYDYIFRASAKRENVVTNPYTGARINKTKYNHLDEFMAFSLTNENFGTFLADLDLSDTQYTKSTWKSLKGANIQETLINLFQSIINFFQGRFTDVNDRTANQEAQRLAYLLSRINNREKSKRYEVLKKFTGYSEKLSSVGNSLIKSAFKKAVPKAETFYQATQYLMDDPSRGGQFFREVYNKIDALDQGILKTTAQEARGVTERLAKHYQLLTRRNRVLDSSKEALNHTINQLSNDFFSEELTQKEKQSITRNGLKSDATVLLDSLGETRLLEVFQDDQARQAEIDKILAALQDQERFPETYRYANFYDRSAAALGDFIIHSQFRQGEDAALNAQLISELSGTKEAGNISDTDAAKVAGLIDQLASLYAIGSMSVSNRASFAAIMEKDIRGIAKTLKLHKMLKEEALATNFHGQTRLFQKGYVKQILNVEKQFVYGTVQDERELSKYGFTRQPNPLPRDSVDPYKIHDIFVYTANTGRMNNLQSGVFSYTRNRARGTSSRLLVNQTDTNTKQGLINTAKIIKRKSRQRDKMFTATRNLQSKLTNQMVGKVDQAGNTIDYRYMMSESTKDAFMEQVNDFDAVLGGMASQMIDKRVTPSINEEAVRSLKEVYDAEYQENPTKFKAIGPNVRDPEMVEQFYLLPEKTRAVVRKVWGSASTMYVPKDLMTLYFGYRKYSIVEAFTKKPAERARLEKMAIALFNTIARGDQAKGINIANNAERIAIELAQYAKDNIIVKSATVTLGNFGSNLVYLRMRGVPISMILKHGWDAIKYGTQFQAENLKANKLDIRKKLLEKENTPEAKQELKKVEKELMQLSDALARNPVLDSIESGLMPALVDEVDTQGNQNFFPGIVERFIDEKTKRLPGIIKSAGKVAFLAQDTEAYKVLNNGVKLTDFVGRHILYNHYVQSQGMDPKEAVGRAIEEFVNFDIPSHRITEYFNEIGFLWFTKYATRIPGIAMKSIKDKPFDSLMSYWMSTHLGLDNIVDSVVPDLGYKIGTAPTTLIGSSDELATAQGLGVLFDTLIP